MGNSIKRLFSIANTNQCEEVIEKTTNDDGTVTMRQVIRPVIKDGKRVYTTNIKLVCDNDPNYTFPPVIKLATLNKLIKGTKVGLVENANYVLQKRDGVITPTNRPKDKDGKVRGYSTQIYVAEYVRKPGKACTDLG